jgi:hypothetical protein
MEELKKEQKNVKPKVVKQKKQVVEQVVEQLVESSPEVKEENKVVKVKKPNNWITHVKDVAEINNLSYREALKIAGQTYQK